MAENTGERISAELAALKREVGSIRKDLTGVVRPQPPGSTLPPGNIITQIDLENAEAATVTGFSLAYTEIQSGGKYIGQVEMTWPAFSSSRGIREYKVWRSPAAVDAEAIFMATVPAGTTTWTDLLPLVGQSVYYGISAVTLLGKESPIYWGASISARYTVTPDSTGIVVTVDFEPDATPAITAIVDWSQATQQADSFRLEWFNGTDWIIVDSTIKARTYAHRVMGEFTPTQVNTWRYKVSAIDRFGNVATAGVTYTPSLAANAWTYQLPNVVAGDLKAVASGRNIYVSILQLAATYIGQDGIIVQVSQDNATWYALGFDSGATTDRWKSGAAGGTSTLGFSFTHSNLPLSGEGGDAVAAQNYYYRFKRKSLVSGKDSAAYYTTAAIQAQPINRDLAANALRQGNIDLAAWLNSQPIQQGLEAHWSFDDVPDYPNDPAGTTYVQDAWATTDGWNGSSATAAVANGAIKTTLTGNGGNINKNVGTLNARMVAARVRGTAGRTLQFVYYTGSAYVAIKSIVLTGDWQIMVGYLASGSSNNVLYIPLGDGVTGQWFELDWIYVGTGLYANKAKDHSGKARRLTIARAYPVQGVNGKALYFLGDTANGAVDNSLTPMSAVSFSGWIDNSKNSGTRTAIFDLVGTDGTGGPNRLLFVKGYDGSALFNLYHNAGWLGGYGTVYPTALLTHVALVVSGTSALLYVNAVLVKTWTLGVAFQSDSRTIRVGGYTDGSSPIAGLADEFRIYSRALTEAEIRYLFLNPGGPIPAIFGADRIIARSITAEEVVAKSITTGELAVDQITDLKPTGSTLDSGLNYWHLNGANQGKARIGTVNTYLEVDPQANAGAGLVKVVGPNAEINAKVTFTADSPAKTYVDGADSANAAAAAAAQSDADAAQSTANSKTKDHGNLASAPTATTTGDTYYNTTDKKGYVWNGSAWTERAIEMASLGTTIVSGGKIKTENLTINSLPPQMARWGLDADGGADNSGNGRRLSKSGAVTYTPSGIVGGAAVFSPATAMYLSTPAFARSGTAGQFAVSLWVKRTGDSNSAHAALIHQSSGDLTSGTAGRGWGIFLGNTTTSLVVYFRWNVAGTLRALNSGNIVNNEWTHICVVYNGNGTTALYINGVAVHSLPHTDGEAWRADYATYIGRWSGYDRRFNGNIDDVIIFDRALTAEQVAYLRFNPNVPTTKIAGGQIETGQVVSNSASTYDSTSDAAKTEIDLDNAVIRLSKKIGTLERLVVALQANADASLTGLIATMKDTGGTTRTRVRVVADGFVIDYNSGTEASPVWNTRFSVDGNGRARLNSNSAVPLFIDKAEIGSLYTLSMTDAEDDSALIGVTFTNGGQLYSALTSWLLADATAMCDGKSGAGSREYYHVQVNSSDTQIVISRTGFSLTLTSSTGTITAFTVYALHRGLLVNSDLLPRYGASVLGEDKINMGSAAQRFRTVFALDVNASKTIAATENLTAGGYAQATKGYRMTKVVGNVSATEATIYTILEALVGSTVYSGGAGTIIPCFLHYPTVRIGTGWIYRSSSTQITATCNTGTSMAYHNFRSGNSTSVDSALEIWV